MMFDLFYDYTKSHRDSLIQSTLHNSESSLMNDMDPLPRIVQQDADLFPLMEIDISLI